MNIEHLDHTHNQTLTTSHTHNTEGNGPWDGLGGMIKTMLRRMEKYEGFPGHVYCETQADIWSFLSQHWSSDCGSSSSKTGVVRRCHPDGSVDVDVGIGTEEVTNVHKTRVYPLENNTSGDLG